MQRGANADGFLKRHIKSIVVRKGAGPYSLIKSDQELRFAQVSGRKLVTNLHKKETKSKPSHYRPIPLLSAVNKTLSFLGEARHVITRIRLQERPVHPRPVPLTVQFLSRQHRSLQGVYVVQGLMTRLKQRGTVRKLLLRMFSS